MVFALMGVVFIAMMMERLRSDVIAVGAMVVLVFTGLLTPQELFAVFSNQAVIAVACMFVLSAALERTGVIDIVGDGMVFGSREDAFLAVQSEGVG